MVLAKTILGTVDIRHERPKNKFFDTATPPYLRPGWLPPHPRRLSEGPDPAILLIFHEHIYKQVKAAPRYYTRFLKQVVKTERIIVQRRQSVFKSGAVGSSFTQPYHFHNPVQETFYNIFSAKRDADKTIYHEIEYFPIFLLR